MVWRVFIVKMGWVFCVLEVWAGVFDSVWGGGCLVGVFVWNWTSGGFCVVFAIDTFDDFWCGAVCGILCVEYWDGTRGGFIFSLWCRLGRKWLRKGFFSMLILLMYHQMLIDVYVLFPLFV